MASRWGRGSSAGTTRARWSAPASRKRRAFSRTPAFRLAATARWPRNMRRSRPYIRERCSSGAPTSVSASVTNTGTMAATENILGCTPRGRQLVAQARHLLAQRLGTEEGRGPAVAPAHHPPTHVLAARTTTGSGRRVPGAARRSPRPAPRRRAARAGRRAPRPARRRAPHRWPRTRPRGCRPPRRAAAGRTRGPGPRRPPWPASWSGAAVPAPHHDGDSVGDGGDRRGDGEGLEGRSWPQNR